MPILLGLGRALGRSSDESQALICQLFSPEKPIPCQFGEQMKDTDQKPFTSFRPILPRTLSQHLIGTPDTPSTPSGLSSSLDYFDIHKERSPSPNAALPVRVTTSPMKEENPDLKLVYFTLWGSSFTKIKPWGFEIIPEQEHLKFHSDHIQKLFKIVSIPISVCVIVVDIVNH